MRWILIHQISLLQSPSQLSCYLLQIWNDTSLTVVTFPDLYWYLVPRKLSPNYSELWSYYWTQFSMLKYLMFSKEKGRGLVAAYAALDTLRRQRMWQWTGARLLLIVTCAGTSESAFLSWGLRWKGNMNRILSPVKVTTTYYYRKSHHGKFSGLSH